MKRLTALFQAGVVRPDRRRPTALAAVLAAVVLMASACTFGAPADASHPAQSENPDNSPQPTETAAAELPEDWSQVSGRLYRRGWQVDYQLAVPEEYSRGIERGITSVGAGHGGLLPGPPGGK